MQEEYADFMRAKIVPEVAPKPPSVSEPAPKAPSVSVIAPKAPSVSATAPKASSVSVIEEMMTIDGNMKERQYEKCE